MLVVDGQRFGGFARDRRRAAAFVEQLTPAVRGLVEAPRAPPGERQRAQRSILTRRRRARELAAARERARAPRRVEPARARTRGRAPAPRARRAPSACPRRTRCEQPRGQPGERQQVEPVVLEDGGERPRVARADELEVARGNLEARHVAACAARRGRACSSAPSEQPARRIVAQKRRAGCSTSTCGRPRAGPREAMEQVPRLEHRRVERLAVEADERARPRRARPATVASIDRSSA